MWLREDGIVRNVAFYGNCPRHLRNFGMRARRFLPIRRLRWPGRIRSGEPVYVEDLREDQAYRDGNSLARGAVDLGRYPHLRCRAVAARKAAISAGL